MDLWHRLRIKWEQENLEVPHGVSLEELSAFEQRYSVVLPPAMRDYFQVANGNCDMDKDFSTFWPLRDVKLVSEELVDPIHTDRLDYPDCFIFADYLTWCWAYAIHLTEDGDADGPFYMIGGKTPVMVAKTFLEFMEKFDVNPNRLI